MKSIDALQPLVGTWSLTGRSLGLDADNVRGTTTIAWAVPGEVLVFTGEMSVGDFRMHSLEVVWRDALRDDFPAHVYSGNGEGPSDYRWAVEDDGTIVHAGLGATYRGTFSADGDTLSGSWRPDPGADAQPGSAYDAVMRRIVG